MFLFHIACISVEHLLIESPVCRMNLPPKLLLELHLIDNSMAILTEDSEEFLQIRLGEYSILDMDEADVKKYLKAYIRKIK